MSRLPRDPGLAACPRFDDFNSQLIIDWAAVRYGATLVWDDMFVNCSGERHRRPELAHWQLTWEFGHIGFDHLKDQELDRQEALRAAALFIYLFACGVDAGIANRCAAAYAANVTVSRPRKL